jgi:CyaY protein
MTESEFNDLVDNTLTLIEEALDACDVDIDYETVSGILTLVFDNKSKIIINRQTPLKQLWVAAKSGGFHFNYDDTQDCWVKDDNGTELFTALSQYCSEQAGEPVELAP